MPSGLALLRLGRWPLLAVWRASVSRTRPSLSARCLFPCNISKRVFNVVAALGNDLRDRREAAPYRLFGRVQFFLRVHPLPALRDPFDVEVLIALVVELAGSNLARENRSLQPLFPHGSTQLEHDDCML
jgi:hypothetical protein